MVNSIEGFRVVRSVAVLSLLVALAAMTAFPQSGSTQSFNVTDDTALRIRLDDTLTSTDSQVGDPFSATVVEKGEYQGARVYGHIAEIDMSGKIKGHTSMMLRFNRLVMPDGRRAPIHAEILELSNVAVSITCFFVAQTRTPLRSLTSQTQASRSLPTGTPCLNPPVEASICPRKDRRWRSLLCPTLDLRPRRDAPLPIAFPPKRFV
jgi:hypothetical protein